MAKIIVSDLRPAGADLFMDSESYLENLTDAELESTNGGMTPLLTGLLVSNVIAWAWATHELGKW